MKKLYLLSQKAVKVSKLINLITDTLKYFHEEGEKRGVFGSNYNIVSDVDAG